MLFKKPLGFISKSILLLNGLAVFLLLVSYLAPIVKPQTFWPIAFMGIAYPAFLITNVLFILFWLFRKPSFSLISIIAIGIGWKAVNKHFGFNTSPVVIERADTASIRVMSYNIQMFNYPEKEGVNNQREILKLIKSISPDILCVQEFYTRSRGQNDMNKHFIEELGLNFSNFIPAAQNDYDAYGIAIFSKYPILESGSLDINRNKRIVNRVVYSDINKNGKRFRVYNVHLQSIGFQPEDYDFIKNEAPAGNVDVKSTKRIGRLLKWAYIKRNDQIDLLYSHTRGTKIPYIVAGDFNDTPLSYSVNKLSANMKNAFVEKGRGLGITYNGDFPNFQIDYILASKQFKVESFQIIDEKFSDHYPIWSDLLL